MKNKKRLIIIGAVIAIIIIIAIILVLVFGKEKYRVLKVKSFDGTVTYERNGKLKDIIKDLNLFSGDTVTTGSDSVLELLADSDKHIVAEEDTCFSIKATGNEKEGKIKIEMLYGTALYTIDRKLSDEQRFEVHTPNAVLSVRGTIFKVYYDQNKGYTRVDVIEGTVHIKAGDKETDLNEGESVFATDDEIQPITDIADYNVGVGENDINYNDEIDVLKNANVGDTLYFGNYTCTTGRVNQNGPIEWYVVEKADGKAMLLALKAVESLPYNSVEADVTWESCTLRAWLNDDFIKIAFSESEQEAIIPTNLENQYTTDKGTVVGCDITTDKVWLLSLDEAEKIKTDHSDIFNIENFWWLRSSSRYWYDNACLVDGCGLISSSGHPVEQEIIFVRPAIYVKY